MKITKGIKKQLTDEMNVILGKMIAEEGIQAEARIAMDSELASDEERAAASDKYYRSIDIWEQLEKQYTIYAALVNARKLKVSPDTLLIVCGGLVEILLILNYERIGIITSKAMNSVLRKRV